MKYAPWIKGCGGKKNETKEGGELVHERQTDGSMRTRRRSRTPTFAVVICISTSVVSQFTALSDNFLCCLLNAASRIDVDVGVFLVKSMAATTTNGKTRKKMMMTDRWALESKSPQVVKSGREVTAPKARLLGKIWFGCVKQNLLSLMAHQGR